MAVVSRRRLTMDRDSLVAIALLFAVSIPAQAQTPCPRPIPGSTFGYWPTQWTSGKVPPLPAPAYVTITPPNPPVPQPRQSTPNNIGVCAVQFPPAGFDYRWTARGAPTAGYAQTQCFSGKAPPPLRAVPKPIPVPGSASTAAYWPPAFREYERPAAQPVLPQPK